LVTTHPSFGPQQTPRRTALQAAVELVRAARAKVPMALVPSKWRRQMEEYHEAVELLAVHAEQTGGKGGKAPPRGAQGEAASDKQQSSSG